MGGRAAVISAEYKEWREMMSLLSLMQRCRAKSAPISTRHHRGLIIVFDSCNGQLLLLIFLAVMSASIFTEWSQLFSWRRHFLAAATVHFLILAPQQRTDNSIVYHYMSASSGNSVMFCLGYMSSSVFEADEHSTQPKSSRKKGIQLITRLHRKQNSSKESRMPGLYQNEVEAPQELLWLGLETTELELFHSVSGWSAKKRDWNSGALSTTLKLFHLSDTNTYIC